MADTRTMTDLRGMSETMETKCKENEIREKLAIERTEIEKGRILDARRKISELKEKKAYKV